MSDEHPTLKKFLVRLLIASPCLIIGIGGLAWVLSPFFLLAAAILLASPVAEWLAEPWGNLFLPGRHLTAPQPVYSIPLARKQEGRYEEALAGFLEIAHGWPDQTRAWIEMIEVAVHCLNDGARAEQFFQQGLASLQSEEARRQLTGMYALLTGRLKPVTPVARAPLSLPTNRPPPP